MGCHCAAFLPIGRRHLPSYNHKLSSSPSATNTMFSSVLAFCERDMAARVSNLMAPWKHRKRSVFRLQGVQFDGSAKRQNRSCTKQMDFGCKLFNQGPWDQIVGSSSGSNVIQDCARQNRRKSSHLTISFLAIFVYKTWKPVMDICFRGIDKLSG